MVLEREQETGTELGMKPKRICNLKRGGNSNGEETQTGRKLKRGGNSIYQLASRAALVMPKDGSRMQGSLVLIKINLAIFHKYIF